MLESSKVGTYYTTHLRSEYYYANFTNREVKNQELVSEGTSRLPKPTVSQWQNSEYCQNAQSVPDCHQTTPPFFLRKRNEAILLQAYNLFSHIHPINLRRN